MWYWSYTFSLVLQIIIVSKAVTNIVSFARIVFVTTPRPVFSNLHHPPAVKPDNYCNPMNSIYAQYYAVTLLTHEGHPMTRLSITAMTKYIWNVCNFFSVTPFISVVFCNHQHIRLPRVVTKCGIVVLILVVIWISFRCTHFKMKCLLTGYVKY